ncbi:MAG TPA: alkaline phosphatase [Pirellulales bacterium]
MRRSTLMGLLLLAFFLRVGVAHGQQCAGVWRSLLNGKDLDGWRVSDCQAVVEDGLLVLTSGEGLVRTNDQFGDFVLELEWKARKDADWDSGIFFRAEAPPPGKPWPTRYQVNLHQGKEGNVGGLPGAESKGLVRDGQWNRFRLSVFGDQAALEINGKPAWRAGGVTPDRGFIGLQAEVTQGGQFEFRGIRILTFPDAALQNKADPLRQLQAQALLKGRAEWGHWGIDPKRYVGWTRHSNRLIPIYTFGVSLQGLSGDGSPYRDPQRVRRLYGRLPERTLNPHAVYFDQTDVYTLQKQAVAAGKKRIILMVFDGMDWVTTQAAAIFKSGKVYDSGRGSGLAFQDYRGVETDFGFFVTSPHNGGTKADVDAQTIIVSGSAVMGGYDAGRGGETPWTPPTDPAYLLGQSLENKQAVTDSAASATSLTSGIKTYNDSINVDIDGKQVVPLARELQEAGWAVGVVTSVPISHATPAAAYANNVWRDDYQDLSRDLLGLPSVAHRQALPGVDVLLGAGWGQDAQQDRGQGQNFVPGNKCLADDDLAKIDAKHGGEYVVALRRSGANGAQLIAEAAQQAARTRKRLFGYFGVCNGHLPFQTADGGYNPPSGASIIPEIYSDADRAENPTLADLTRAALAVLGERDAPFWLMVEAGDVDWANHDDNLDNSIGAVLSGDEAFRAITDWIEAHDGWRETAVIVTADHGHFLVLEDPRVLVQQRP